jgi:hypothetical protein
MTQWTAIHDTTGESPEGRRQHAPADVAPELYDPADPTDSSAESK